MTSLRQIEANRQNAPLSMLLVRTYRQLAAIETQQQLGVFSSILAAFYLPICTVRLDVQELPRFRQHVRRCCVDHFRSGAINVHDLSINSLELEYFPAEANKHRQHQRDPVCASYSYLYLYCVQSNIIRGNIYNRCVTVRRSKQRCNCAFRFCAHK